MVKHNIGWVKSHQDSQSSYDNLPRNAQLNILANALATEYAKHPNYKFQPKSNPQFFLSSQASL